MDEGMEERWRELSEEVLSGIKEWRLTHPKATFREIEQAVQERMSRLEAQLMQDVALASGQRDWSLEERESPRCPVCDTPLQKRGKHTRSAASARWGRNPPGAQLWNLPGVRNRAFPSWIRNWSCSPFSLTPSQHEHLVHLGSWMSFARAGQMMERLLGVQVSEPTVRRLTERAGELVEAVQEEASRQASQGREEAGEASRPDQKLVVSGDGAFVPLLGGQWAEVKLPAIGEVKPASVRARALGGNRSRWRSCRMSRGWLLPSHSGSSSWER